MLYFLNFSYEPNTAMGNRLNGYYKSLDELGIEATVVYLFPNEHYDIPLANFDSIHIEYYWKRWLPYRGIFRRLTLKKYIIRFISKLTTGDIVYTYNISKMTRLCQHVPGIRVFAERTEHPDASNGFFHPLLSLTEEELKDTIRHLDGLFVISNPLKHYYASLGLSERRIHIINMTVDKTRFDNLIKTETDNYIAYCGTASNNKDGVNDLIHAFSIVAKQNHDIKLYIIGKTPSKEEKFDNLELVKKYGLLDRVVFTGIVNADKIPQLLKNAKVLALDRPNNLQAKYGFPTKLGEYLLTGNPVIVTSVGDIPLFLSDGDSALISEPSNAQMFAKKIIWALNNYEKALEIGQRGYNIALYHFNSFIETKKLYDFIINR